MMINIKRSTCEGEEFTKIRLSPVSLKNLNLEKPRACRMFLGHFYSFSWKATCKAETASLYDLHGRIFDRGWWWTQFQPGIFRCLEFYTKGVHCQRSDWERNTFC